MSLVAFDTYVETLADPATGEEQQDLIHLIDEIYAGSATNLSGGWLKGREHVDAHRQKGAVNRVLLMTDGQANQGITDAAKLSGICRSAAENGVTTTTIGFGEGFREQLLQAMADAGGGATYYIEETDQAHGVFEEELEGLLSVCAQNLAVQLRPTQGNEFVQVWHGYPSETEEDLLTLTIGDLYAREPRLVLAEFLLKPAEDGKEQEEVEIATYTVTADVVTPKGDVEKHTVTLPLMLSPVEGGVREPRGAQGTAAPGGRAHAKGSARGLGAGGHRGGRPETAFNEREDDEHPVRGRRAARSGPGPAHGGAAGGPARGVGEGAQVHDAARVRREAQQEEGVGAGVAGEAGGGGREAAGGRGEAAGRRLSRKTRFI